MMTSSGGPPTLIDLMLFHKMDRELFHRLTHHLSLDPDAMHSVMALWLWLESINYYHFIRFVSSFDDEVVLDYVAEAESSLDVLYNPDTVRTDIDLPNMSRLMMHPVNHRFFNFLREDAVKGVNGIRKNVCRVIFDEELLAVVARDVNHPAYRRLLVTSGVAMGPFGEGSSSMPVLEVTNNITPLLPNLVPLPAPVAFNLNPMARPWTPVSQGQTSEEDRRSMFITFSKGHPISREDIMEFFTERYGPCVEVVMIEKAPSGVRPMYGRVVFTSPTMIGTVLNGQSTAKFVIKGKHLWARMYVPRSTSFSCT